jgi:hypothetical protein
MERVYSIATTLKGQEEAIKHIFDLDLKKATKVAYNFIKEGDVFNTSITDVTDFDYPVDVYNKDVVKTTEDDKQLFIKVITELNKTKIEEILNSNVSDKNKIESILELSTVLYVSLAQGNIVDNVLVGDFETCIDNNKQYFFGE